MQVIDAHGARIPVMGFGTMTLKEDMCVDLAGDPLAERAHRSPPQAPAGDP